MITLGLKDLEENLRASGSYLIKGTMPEIAASALPKSLDKGQTLLLVIIEVPK